jgi:hypothetical protein
MPNIKQTMLDRMPEGQWVNPKDIAEQTGLTAYQCQCAFYSLFRDGKILKETRIEAQENERNQRRHNYYKKRKSNLFDPDEFYSHYRDPVKQGMSLKRHPDHVHL